MTLLPDEGPEYDVEDIPDFDDGERCTLCGGLLDEYEIGQHVCDDCAEQLEMK